MSNAIYVGKNNKALAHKVADFHYVSGITFHRLKDALLQSPEVDFVMVLPEEGSPVTSIGIFRKEESE